MILYAILLRLALLAFSMWQDYTRWPDGQLRFTDVDYDVFTDAAKAMVSGEDIYKARPTYRYSPLIALLIAPGHYLVAAAKLRGLSEGGWAVALLALSAAVFGKLIFIIADILCAFMQRKIILLETKEYAASPDRGVRSSSTLSWLVGVFWLFNPITAAVSVRGNAESVLGLVILACLYCVLRRLVLPAGLLFGLAIHLKLYPVIYAPVIYLMLCNYKLHNASAGPVKGRLNRIIYALLPITADLWLFALSTLVSLCGLTAVGYAVYGWTFLHSAYFYHFTRVDFWHNFAPHFYPIYLFEGVLATPRLSSAFDGSLFPLNFLPLSVVQWFYTPENLQWAYTMFKIAIMMPPFVLIPVLSWQQRRKPSFAWFAITFAFVAFNKVCTSQYFLWWLVLLPAALAHIPLPLTPSSLIPGVLVTRLTAVGLHPSAVARSLALFILWLAGQGAWLSMAYSHEMQSAANWGNKSLWFLLWSASCTFFFINIAILCLLLQWVQPRAETNRYKGRKTSDGKTTAKEVTSILHDSSSAELRHRKRYNKAAAF